MTHVMTSQNIALNALSLHPSNVRAKSPETYAVENISHLAASIKALGLMHPLIVQKTNTGFGVLAGGRRLAALKALSKDKAVKDYTGKTEVPCRVLAPECDLATAMSLAENITQAVMQPIDEFEAFARMLEVDGQSVETIAKTFGTTQSAVKERLRYGLVHADIREAVRRKDISLDVMKAFANHPARDVQIEVYKALKKTGDLQSFTVRRVLAERGLQVCDTLGAFIVEDYKAHGGAIASDLLADNAVLEDRELIDAILEDKLREAAEVERARLGFAWADVATQHDWQMFQAYDRVYPSDIVPDAKAQKRLAAIAAEVTKLEERRDAEDTSDVEYDKLYDQIDVLEEEASALQTAYADEDLARAGVFATWNDGVQLTLGLVRPEDRTGKARSGTAADGNKTKDAEDGVLTLGNSVLNDLSTERAMALGLALAQSPKIAADLAMFKIVTDAESQGMSITHAIGITASVADRSHSRMDEIDQTPGLEMRRIHDALDLSWCKEAASPADQFAAFQALTPTVKTKLVAYAISLTIKPGLARDVQRDSVMQAIEVQIMPDIRAHWAPNAAFFARLKKADLLAILRVDLGLVEEAGNLASSKKAEIVTFCDTLFADPFPTLTEDQRAAVASWCPPGMQTAQLECDTIISIEGKSETKQNAKKAA